MNYKLETLSYEQLMQLREDTRKEMVARQDSRHRALAAQPEQQTKETK